MEISSLILGRDLHIVGESGIIKPCLANYYDDKATIMAKIKSSPEAGHEINAVIFNSVTGKNKKLAYEDSEELTHEKWLFIQDFISEYREHFSRIVTNDPSLLKKGIERIGG